MNDFKPDRMMILVLSGFQSGTLMKQLHKEGFRFTIIDNTSGMVQEPMVVLLVGFHQEQMEELLAVVRENCRPYKQYIPTRGLLQGELANLPMVEAQLGGAQLYLMNIERFEQF